MADATLPGAAMKTKISRLALARFIAFDIAYDDAQQRISHFRAQRGPPLVDKIASRRLRFRTHLHFMMHAI